MKLLYLLMILSFIAVIVFINLNIYIAYKHSKKAEKAFTFMSQNTLECGQLRCPLRPQINPPPGFSVENPLTSDGGKAMLEFAANTIALTEQRYFHSDIKPPPETSVVRNLVYQNKFFGWVLKHNTKNEYYVFFRGTITSNEWKKDLMFDQTDMRLTYSDFLSNFSDVSPIASPSPEKQLTCHRGFLVVYNAMKDQLSAALPSGVPTLFVGHSLGASVASLAAYFRGNLQSVLYTFASPRVFNPAILDILLPYPHYRIVNNADVIPQLPLAVMPNVSDAEHPLFFSHYGTQLSFQDNWKSLLNNHLLPVYLKNLNKLT